jgi:nucleoside-diphosphate-sugar epimerase
MILVTGGTGFIGGHLVARLVAQGRPVRCLVRRSSALQNLPRAGIDLAYGDLATGEGLPEAVRGVDTVIHLAGTTKAAAVSGYYTGNAGATANLLRVAGAVRRFVHVSSMAAAGPSTNGGPLVEDLEPHYAPHPVSHYGHSKLEAEQAVRKSALWERCVMVRPPVVYGPGDKDVYQVLRAVARGWMLRIGSVDRRFSLIYVEDLVDGLLAVADHPKAAGKIYYLAHRTPVSWGEFGAAAASLMKRSLRTLSIPEKAAYAVGLCGEWWSRWNGRPGILSRDKVAEACCAGWVCDAGRACRELGFCAPTGLEDGLQRTLAWYREAGWLKF